MLIPFASFSLGAMKRGQDTCGTFKLISYLSIEIDSKLVCMDSLYFTSVKITPI